MIIKKYIYVYHYTKNFYSDGNVKLIFPIELIEKKIVTIQNHSKR